MKKAILAPTAVAGVCAATLFLSGCASTETKPAARPGTTERHRSEKADEDNDRHDRDKAPSLGMSKSEVRQRYGEPDGVSNSPKGEVWIYGDHVRGHDFIPVYGAFSRHHHGGGSVVFGANGRVKDFDWGNLRSHRYWY